MMLLFLLMLSLVAWGEADNEMCNSDQQLTTKLIINSKRNSTGHWVSNVQLAHSDEGEVEGEPWTLEMKQGSAGCSENGFAIIDAILTSPKLNLTSKYEVEERKVDGIGEYLYYKTPVTWTKANRICKRQGMHLAVLNSDAEAQALVKIMNEVPAKSVYYLDNTAHIGFNDLEKEGEYMTVTGQDLRDSGYTRWGPNNPNINFHEDCGGMDRSGLLHDVGCDHLLPFFCEKP